MINITNIIMSIKETIKKNCNDKSINNTIILIYLNSKIKSA